MLLPTSSYSFYLQSPFSKLSHREGKLKKESGLHLETQTFCSLTTQHLTSAPIMPASSSPSAATTSPSVRSTRRRRLTEAMNTWSTIRKPFVPEIIINTSVNYSSITSITIIIMIIKIKLFLYRHENWSDIGCCKTTSTKTSHEIPNTKIRKKYGLSR